MDLGRPVAPIDAGPRSDAGPSRDAGPLPASAGECDPFEATWHVENLGELGTFLVSTEEDTLPSCILGVVVSEEVAHELSAYSDVDCGFVGILDGPLCREFSTEWDAGRPTSLEHLCALESAAGAGAAWTCWEFLE